MIFRRPQVGLALIALATFTLAGSRSARAYDSSGPDIKPQTHAQPTPPPPWPFGPPYLESSPDYPDDPFMVDYTAGGDGSPYSTVVAKQNGIFNFELKMLHDLQGANAEFGLDPDFGDSSGVLLCNWPQDSTQAGFGDWTQCTAWPASVTTKMPGWVKVHRAWDTRASGATTNTEAPEHMDIAIASAQAAGLGNLPLFNSTFWVRYPVNGTWLSTYVAPASGNPSSGWATAPSWAPVDFNSMGALATRGFQLPELAQLPDVANAVWDWAGGDEICPVNGLDTTVTNPNGTQTVYSAFGSTAKDLNACHDFSSVMGAVNASHFMPLAETYYHYYHTLALDRMAQCLAMSQALAPVYAVQGDDPQWEAYRSPNDSEVNVCEQEAFTYEMNAQHYLQDAWSTGHMWFRWGYPDLAPFPSSAGAYPPGQVEAPSDVAARRMVIAGTVASYAGTIHGAKGVTGNLIPWAGEALNDPLCGPAYSDPGNPQPISQLVQWTMPDKSLNPGVGDLFFNPYTGANLSSDVTYSTQRQHLLACGARSLYDLYTSGPQSYGGATPGSVGGLSVNDPSLQAGTDFDQFCFGQSITNDSMSGALGSFYLTHDWTKIFGNIPLPLPDPRDTIFSLVNQVLLLQRVGSTSFNDGADWVNFIRVALLKLGNDTQLLKAVLNARAVLDPKGTSSSQLLGPTAGTQLTMLGVPPNTQPPATQAPSSFVDLLTSQPTGIPQDAVRRMFWRAHPEDVCSQDLVNTLRARCIAGAAFGGDAEACTSCVDIAELEVPVCSSQAGGGGDDGGLATSPVPVIGPSKCSALGEDGPTDQLPASWWDPASRVPTCDTFPSYWLAFSYCTGTSPLPFEGNTDYGWGRTVLSTTPTTTSACVDPVTQQAPPLVNMATLVAYAHRELSTTAQTARPIVTAWNQLETEKEIVVQGEDGPGCTDYFTASKDQLVQDIVPFPLFMDPGPNSELALVSEDTLARLAPYNLPLCGTTQRLTVWNRNCADVIGQFAGVLELGGSPQINTPLDPTTGIEAMSVSTSTGSYAGQERCSLREARTFSMQCPPQTVCSTSGICVPGRDSTGMPIGGVPPDPQILVRP